MINFSPKCLLPDPIYTYKKFDRVSLFYNQKNNGIFKKKKSLQCTNCDRKYVTFSFQMPSVEIRFLLNIYIFKSK